MSAYDEPKNFVNDNAPTTSAGNVQGHHKGDDVETSKRFLLIMRRHSVAASITFLAVFAVFAIYTFTRQPLYSSLTVVDLNPNGRGGSAIGDIQQQNLGYEEAKSRVATQIEVLRGDTLSLDTCNRLGLLNIPAFINTLKDQVSGTCNNLTPHGRAVVLKAMRKMLQIDSVAGTNLVHIEAVTPNRELSEKIANGLVDSFIISNLRASVTVPNQKTEETFKPVELRVIEVAALADEPVYPQKARMLAFGFLVAIFAACVAAYMLNFLDSFRMPGPIGHQSSASSNDETSRNS